MMATTPEGKVKDLIKKQLKAEKSWHYMPVQNGMGRVGIPDFVACVPITITANLVGKTIGAFVAVETKAPGKLKNTTPNQRKNLAEIHQAGGVAVVTDNDEILPQALSVLRLSGVPMYYVPME